MPVSDEYIAFIRDLLVDFEPLRVKRMFGGAGIYSGGLFFAILVDNTLYLKADEGNRADYEHLGLVPFSYRTKNGRTGTMSYYPPPADVIEDQEALHTWVLKALEAAQRSDAAKHRTN